MEGQRHELQVGDVLALEGCDGLTAGGEDEALVVRRVVNATSFVVRGTQQLGTYKQGGAFRQVGPGRQAAPRGGMADGHVVDCLPGSAGVLCASSFRSSSP